MSVVAPWDRRSSSEHARLQRLLLQQWIVTAADYSPYWNDRFDAAPVAASKVESPEDLLRLSPIREADVAFAGGPGGPALLMRPTEAQVKATADSSTLMEIARRIRRDGAGGKRLVLLQEFKPIHVHAAGRDGALNVAYSRTDLDRLHRAGKRAASVMGLSDHDYLVSAVTPRPELAFWGLHHLALGSSMLALHPRGAAGELSQVAAAFDLVPATAIAVETGQAVALAASLVEAGAILDRVRTIIVVGPPPDGVERARIAEAFRAAGGSPNLKVIALWAPSEVRAPWAECVEGVSDDGSTGLHTYPDLELLELVNPVTGRATDASSGVALERDGDLTYTSAGWNGTALIRYQTGDYVEQLTSETCPACGRSVPRVVGEVVPGAWQPLLQTPDGEARVDLRGAAAVLGSTSGVGAWRLELRGPTQRIKHDRVLVEVAADEHDTPGLDERLRAALGVEPTKVKYVADPSTVEAKVTEVGGLFADLR